LAGLSSYSIPLKVRGIKGVMIGAEVFIHNSPNPSYLKRGNFGKTCLLPAYSFPGMGLATVFIAM